ncbi:MAG: hypothetical protein GY940_36275 [bacterium]|nr:hypothetical protein [bacterium]
MKRFILALSILFLLSSLSAQFPVIEQGDVKPNDKRLNNPVGTSKAGELTIVSFNIRNLGSRGRNLKDYEAIADLVNEGDVVVIQEAGLGLHTKQGEEVTKKEKTRMDAVVALFRIFLGNDQWSVIRPPHPSGQKAGRETAILAFRNKGQGYDINGSWLQYVDLSESKRDMPVFKVTLKKGNETKELFIGSVHLTPEDPDRGEQMIKAADWMLQNKDKWTIVTGDFNWGYKKNSKIPADQNYLGEEKVIKLHKNQEIFQLFHALSYNGKGNSTQLRTNLGFRKGAFFYDQFLLTPPLATKMADGGKLLEDCGLIAFGVHNKYMKKAIEKAQKRRQYGFDKYFKHLEKAGVSKADLNDAQNKAFDATMKNLSSIAQNDATWVISDHRAVWMQLEVF